MRIASRFFSVAACVGVVAATAMTWSRQQPPVLCQSSAIPIIPVDQVRPFEHQVGGRNIRGGGKSFLQCQDGTVLKPLLPDHRGQSETTFYEHVFGSECCKSLRPFLPKYHGLVQVDGRCYLKLEDVSHGYRFPCIVDLKVGTRTYDERATPKKRDYELSKYPWQQTLGFRLTAMKVYDAVTGGYQSYDKHYGRSLTPELMPTAFNTFFQTSTLGSPAPAQQQIEANVSHLRDVLQTCGHHQMIASSLLLLYDAQPASSPSATPARVGVYMIDFGHVQPLPGGERDAGYLTGITSILKHLRSS